MVVTSVLLGLLLSLVGLIPGLHIIAWLPAIFGLLSGDGALLSGAVFVGASTVLTVLHATYHPVASSMLASADVPAKLAFHGFGRDVVQSWRYACISAVIVTLGLAGMLVVPELLGFKVTELMVGAIKPLTPLLLLGILGLVVFRSGRPVMTFAVCALAGTVGFVAFNVLRDAAMTPLLGGLFGLPAALALMGDHAGKPVENNGIWPVKPQVVSRDDVKGACLGMLTGLLAGVGTGSLVAAMRTEGMDPMRYVRLSASADMGNNIFALLLFALLGSTRSGVAAGVQASGSHGDPFLLLIIAVAVTIGAWFGSVATARLEAGYMRMANAISMRTVGIVLTVVTLWGCWHAAGVGGIVLAGTAAALSSLAKTWRTPNQALLTALAGPALISGLGLTLVAKGLLGV